MAIVELSGGVWYPHLYDSFYGTNDLTYLIDASSEKSVMIFEAPKSGDIDRVDVYIVVGNSPDNGLRVSLQGVDASGQNNGTILGATNNAYVTYAHTVSTGWKSSNFGEVATVTKGQLLAAVVDIPSFTASDSVTIRRHQVSSNGFPYGISDTGTKQTANYPAMAVHYTTGYEPLNPQVRGVLTLTNLSYNLNTGTADEWGLAFTLPIAARLRRVGGLIGAAAGADHEIILYDSGGSVVSTITVDGDHAGATGVNRVSREFSADIDLSEGQLYRIMVRPTTTNNVILGYEEYSSLDLMDTSPGGQDFYMTSRLNQGGSWTNYNSGTFRKPHLALGLVGFDSGGGGLLAHPGMRGGFA